jgi:NADH-quinone oxidoreductase subunit L
MTIETLIWLIPLPPLLSFFIIVLLTNRNKALSHSVAIGSVALSWLGSMVVFIRALSVDHFSQHPFASAVRWLPTGETWFEIGVHIDPFSAITLFFVAWTVLMIFIYSVGYQNFKSPEGDRDRMGWIPFGKTIKIVNGHPHKVPSIEPMYSRFFAFISLFAFGMYLLVVSDNLLTLYMGWEIMGLCSYLLIGFWYARKEPQEAAVKAFLTTRIGDMFMLLGIVSLYSATGTLNFYAILNNHETLEALAHAASPIAGLSMAGMIGLLLFIGTIGKSAQFPLHVWLPDAMEGPTPVSAMIHAATMVSAGVYLVIRFFPLLSAGWEAGEPLTTPMMAMAVIGSFTALFAATIAVAQNDVKRVLAYSTISQLGFMIAALGVGAYVAAAFHLVTHAFFKALLFLGSGSIIHGMQHGALHVDDKIDPQNMCNMGGLRDFMPVTFWTFVAGGLALSGFPIVTAGFWSKDEILGGAYNGGHMVVFVMLALAAFLTAFYTMRQITLVFLGKGRSCSARNAHESAPSMTIPLIVLAVFAIAAGWVGIPDAFPGLGGILPPWFQNFVGSMLGDHGGNHEEAHSLVPLFTSLGVSLGGLLLGWLAYRNFNDCDQPDPIERLIGPFYKVLKNKYYVDEIYQFLLIKPTQEIARTFSYRFIDKGILDNIVHSVGYVGLGLGRMIRNWFDLPVINGFGDNLSDGARRLGSSLRGVQTGRVQQYMLAAMVVFAIIGILFYRYLFLT